MFLAPLAQAGSALDVTSEDQPDAEEKDVNSGNVQQASGVASWAGWSMGGVGSLTSKIYSKGSTPTSNASTTSTSSPASATDVSTYQRNNLSTLQTINAAAATEILRQTTADCQVETYFTTESGSAIHCFQFINWWRVQFFYRLAAFRRSSSGSSG